MGPCKPRVLVFGLVCVFVFSVNGTDQKQRHNRQLPEQPNSQADKCDFTNVEARIQRFEAHIDDKINGLRRDVWSSSRSIEQQASATKNVIEEYRNELRSQAERLRRNHQLQSGQNPQSSDLERQVQLVIATLRLLSADITVVRQNLSDVLNTTSAIRNQLQIDTNIQQIFNPSQQPKSTPSNCQEIKQNNHEAPSSIYLVQPKNGKSSFFVYCDMDYQDGGWLTIHNRFLGDQDFYRDWQDYKAGFGNIAGEHWLGLEHVYELTGSEIHELLIQLVDINEVKTFAHYSHFSIGSEEEGYALKILGGFRGDAGDSLSYHAGSKFSTKDKDQDSWQEGHCAQSHGGAWWYKSCDKSNLNGRYLPGDQPDIFLYQPMYWGTFGGPQTGLKYARMLIRPRQEASETTMRI